ncbi:MAG: hypothetical protein J6K86_02905 [Clostridia bacterium]|nr:hypothetical protein [Clostridia bacterium]
MKKFCALLLSLITLCSAATSCDIPANNSSSVSTDSSSLLGENSSSSSDGYYQDRDSSSSDTVDSSSSVGEYNEQHAIVDEAYTLSIGESMSGTYTLTGKVTSVSSGKKLTIIIAVEGREDKPIQCYNLTGEGATSLKVGDIATVSGTLKNYQGTIEFDSGCILIDYESFLPDGNDPYANVSKTEFYANYKPAKSNADAFYRSQHGFMSGELTVPDQAPTLSSYQPKDGTLFIRNSEMRFEDNGDTYVVVDAYGNEAFSVYRYGAYITLEEVAAYVYAFGTYPANYTTSKNTSPSSSVWGEYLRLNHTAFSGDTSKYPYEPVLPNISGCGGSLHYYEMDVGTTGTDCDPSYPVEIYNDGWNITRGAARIVYGKHDLDGDGVFEHGEHHLFYTYNHYNDFQEYLNYEGGWGELFGNITGGGTISSKYDYNPTDYVPVSFQSLTTKVLFRTPIQKQR